MKDGQLLQGLPFQSQGETLGRLSFCISVLHPFDLHFFNERTILKKSVKSDPAGVF